MFTSLQKIRSNDVFYSVGNTGPAPRGAFRGPYSPKSLLVLPSKREYTIVPGRKTQVNAKTKPKISPPLFLVFTPESVDRNRDPHHRIPLSPARLRTYPLERELYHEKKQTALNHWASFLINTFFGLHFKIKKKNYLCTPKYFSAPTRITSQPN